MQRSSFVLPIVLFVMPVIVLANDYKEVEAWLQKMHKAAHTLNYKGKFVYQQDKQLSLMRIIHSVDKNGERERLVSMDQTGREIIRNKNKVTCILPDSKSVVVDKSRPELQFPPSFPMKLDNIRNQYRFAVDKLEKIAGQRAQKLVIQPKDNYRYGHRLWVDEKTGLLLKTHLIDEKGELLEQFMFTEIEFLDVVPEHLLKPAISGDEYTWYEAQETNDTDAVEQSKVTWSITQLPAGFNSDMQRSHNMPNKTSVQQLVFSDGLASVSVFIEKHKAHSPNITGASHMGAVNAFGRKLNNYHITVVGEVPRATVQLIGESVVNKHK